MEYVDNARTLKHEIRRRIRHSEPFDIPTLHHIFDDILNALEAAHTQQIIHLDIKPTNIMLQRITGDPHHVRILDFGLSRLLEAQDLDAGTISGTPAYMAPEQILDDEIGPWTDLYSVGILLFQLLTGRRPFPGGDSQEIIGLKLRSDFDPLSQLPDSAPFYLRAFFRRALAREKADRYRSVTEFRTALHWVFDNLTGDAVREVAAPNLSDILEGSDRVSRSERSDSLGRRRADVSFSDEIWRTPSLNMRLSGRTIAWASAFLVLLVVALVGFRFRAKPLAAEAFDAAPERLALWRDLGGLAVQLHQAEALRLEREKKRLAALARKKKAQTPGVSPTLQRNEVVIHVDSDPAGAQLIRDGETLGPAPQALKTKRSSELIRLVVRKRGFQTQTLLLPSDRDQKVTIRMKKLPAMRNNFVRKIWK